MNTTASTACYTTYLLLTAMRLKRSFTKKSQQTRNATLLNKLIRTKHKRKLNALHVLHFTYSTSVDKMKISNQDSSNIFFYGEKKIFKLFIFRRNNEAQLRWHYSKHEHQTLNFQIRSQTSYHHRNIGIRSYNTNNYDNNYDTDNDIFSVIIS